MALDVDTARDFPVRIPTTAGLRSSGIRASSHESRAEPVATGCLPFLRTIPRAPAARGAAGGSEVLLGPLSSGWGNSYRLGSPDRGILERLWRRISHTPSTTPTPP